MKTAMIALYEVYPPISGAASVSYDLARHLPGDVVLFQMMHKTTRTETEGEVRTVGFSYASDRHLLKVLSICRRLPGIVGALKSERPDVVVLEGASWAVYLLLVFVFLRVRGVRCPIIYHSHNVEYLLRKTRNGSFVSSITRRAEKILCRRSNLATAVSPVDARAIEMLYGLAPVIVPNGVDPDRFDVPPTETARVASKYGITDGTILFMGLSDFPPNREAIAALVSRIFPAALRSVPSLKLAVIGGRIPFQRDWLLNPGSIPYAEVPAFVKACTLCVAPISSGSGTRVKLLEYMAAGRPVVSTSKGSEGLGAISGVHLLIADSDEAFADKIVCLVRDSALSETLGRQARLFVRKRFSWQVIADRLAHEIRNLTFGGMNNASQAGSPEGVISHD